MFIKLNVVRTGAIRINTSNIVFYRKDSGSEGSVIYITEIYTNGLVVNESPSEIDRLIEEALRK